MPLPIIQDRRFGWRPQLPDLRDFQYAAAFPQMAKLPQVVYLIKPPVQDQGQEGSCVFNACTSAMEAAEIDENQIPPLMLSRSFAYYDYRKRAGEIPDDNGAVIRVALKVLAQDGTCLESSWPYIPVDQPNSNFATEPPPECWQEAKKHQVVKYYALNGLNDMLQCMAGGFGFVCGISVYASFMSAGSTGIVPLPQPNEDFLGGHGLYFWGYDRHKKVFHGLNSWGQGWGNQGSFTIPFDYLTNRDLASDFWTVRTVEV